MYLNMPAAAFAAACVAVFVMLTVGPALIISRTKARQAARKRHPSAQAQAGVVQDCDGDWFNIERELFTQKSIDMADFEVRFTFDDQRAAQQLSLKFPDRQAKR